MSLLSRMPKILDRHGMEYVPPDLNDVAPAVGRTFTTKRLADTQAARAKIDDGMRELRDTIVRASRGERACPTECRSRHGWVDNETKPETVAEAMDTMRLPKRKSFGLPKSASSMRNLRCPCGSGRKFKECCIRKVRPCH